MRESGVQWRVCLQQSCTGRFCVILCKFAPLSTRTLFACGREPWRKVGLFVVEAPVERSMVENSCTAASPL